jgi:hypothetical protein
MEKHLNVPANTEELAELKSGDYVYLTGTSIQLEMRHIKECMKRC